jgi:uracil-DNA glycosylase
MELIRMLHESGLMRKTDADASLISSYYRTKDPRFTLALWAGHPEFYRTNVFQIHPPGNDLSWFCGPKAQGLPGYPALLSGKKNMKYYNGPYVREEFAPELERLQNELLTVDPHLVICLGNTALWAMAGRGAITKIRGTTLVSTHTVSGFKLLPTLHPAAVMRQWDQRPTAIADLMKAVKESSHDKILRPFREIWIEPSLEDLRRFRDEFIAGCSLLSTDIETAGTRITCIGFAPSSRLGIVVPFDDARRADGNYWPNPDDERSAWGIVRGILEDPSIPKLFQNGLYDISFLWRAYGMRTLGAAEDTMLCQHALQPESLKGLGYLGSLYSEEFAWKSLGKHTRRTIKRDN